MINLNSISKKLLLLQRNELLSQRQKFLRKRFGRYIFTNLLINFFQKENIENISSKLFQDEIATIKNYLPKNVNDIMDIGCGLGIINIFLDQIYHNKPNFYLLDKNHIDTKIKYGFSSDYESYNNFNETKKILLENGINENRINLFDVDRDINIEKKINLVISLKSMGYHYPFENYIKLFKNCCSKDTIFIFDIASNQYEVNFFKNYFNEVKIIFNEKSIHPLRRLCCNGLKL